jgi:hypothetical protein
VGDATRLGWPASATGAGARDSSGSARDAGSGPRVLRAKRASGRSSSFIRRCAVGGRGVVVRKWLSKRPDNAGVVVAVPGLNQGLAALSLPAPERTRSGSSENRSALHLPRAESPAGYRPLGRVDGRAGLCKTSQRRPAHDGGAGRKTHQKAAHRALHPSKASPDTKDAGITRSSGQAPLARC